MANYKLAQDEKENMTGPNIAMLAAKMDRSRFSFSELLSRCASKLMHFFYCVRSLTKRCLYTLSPERVLKNSSVESNRFFSLVRPWWREWIVKSRIRYWCLSVGLTKKNSVSNLPLRSITFISRKGRGDKHWFVKGTIVRQIPRSRALKTSIRKSPTEFTL